ncbi:MAG: SUMF1/EgtB/PvdO family nonheme iron enzyme [Treponema sp.]|nr:SUMF1/EgtB/PvdO family nonheme iron enzyme [Treponema sp.]
MLFVTVLFTGCDNFLKGTKVRDELDRIIAYNNAKSYTILVTADKDSGQIKKPISGELTQKATDVFEIKFEPNPEYSFARWEVTSKDLPAGENINDYIELEDAENPDTKVTFKKELSSIVINAVCPHLPFVNFELKGENGNISPVTGTYTCVQTYTYRLTFAPESYYEFIRWEIYDLNAGQEIPNGKYITIDDPKSKDTTYSFAGVPENPQIKIVIRPVVVERPQVISSTPDDFGVRKDTSIQVLFDHDMDKASIYYTKDEMEQMLKEHIADTPWFEETILNENDKPETVYKGYIKDSKIYFKNILITDNKDGTILNQWFEPPVFESSRSLVVRVKRELKNNKLVPLVTNYTQILVTVEKGMSYLSDGKSVGMIGNKRWMYHVGNETDDVSPGVTYTTCNIKISGHDKNLTIEENELQENLNFQTINGLTFLRERNLNLEMNIDVKVDDTNGAGPRTWFKMYLSKVYDDDYKRLETPSSVYEKTIDYNKDVGLDTASYEDKIEFEIPKLTEGIYELGFIFSDICGNETKSIRKYFAKDSLLLVKGAQVSGTVTPPSSVFIENRTVRIPDLLVSDHEVTKKEYETYCKYGDSTFYPHGNNKNIPAYNLNWYDAIVYCNLRTIAEFGLDACVYSINGQKDPTKWDGIVSDAGKYCGPSERKDTWDAIFFDTNAKGYRLPTEVEWEYIARGANKENYTYSGSNNAEEVAWYYKPFTSPQEVKQKKENTLGIYDMSGNVREWCYDWYGDIDKSTGSTGPASGAARVYRGSDITDNGSGITVNARLSYQLELRDKYTGIRVVRTAN